MSEHVLLQEILQEVRGVKTKVESLEGVVHSQSQQLEAHGRMLEAQSQQLEAHGRMLEAQSQQLEAHGQKIDTQSQQLDAHGQGIDTLGSKLDRLSEDFGEFRFNQEQFNTAIWNLNTQAFEAINEIRSEVVAPWKLRKNT
ncbi:hypothetical protein KBD33_04810 [Candidatus Gracilibacteria bacterium]|nr:hypothetical protein [Candidatus Gracilibacteria bacterium]